MNAFTNYIPQLTAVDKSAIQQLTLVTNRTTTTPVNIGKGMGALSKRKRSPSKQPEMMDIPSGSINTETRNHADKQKMIKGKL